MNKFCRVVEMWMELHPTFPDSVHGFRQQDNKSIVSDNKKYSSICRSAEDTEHWRVGLRFSTEVLSFLGDLC